MTTSMAWRPVSNMVIIKKQTDYWRDMTSRKWAHFLENEFLARLKSAIITNKWSRWHEYLLTQ